MDFFAFDLSQYLTEEYVITAAKVVLTVVLGLPLAFAFSRWVRNLVAKHLGAQQALLAGKATSILGMALILVMVLQILDFPLTTLLGAAGIFSLAIAFASQTSVSNIISGIFLASEKILKTGDLVTISGVTGEVLSVDTLSVKLRTFDNRLVRIPNETMIKTEFQNITAFPLRRVDINVGVAYKEDIDQVRTLLLEIAQKHTLVLQEPKPLVIFSGYGDSSINFLFVVWGVREDFLTIRNQVTDEIKRRFDEGGIEIPFPHRTLYTGAECEPFPVRMVDERTA